MDAYQPARGTDETVMASIDRDGSAARLIIADVAADERWLSVPETEARSLDDWR